ncbi:hypothetical protein BOTBODRAFT_632859 [Botryobasidium botryosum FD-172 SS1]|uniref:HTH La-type RNA-binding domain-containing protein n=1 Tax=Botryobasidium botryosum (strain FD-172 SS1) TaxID=930990 RepID=A0A067N957_BOTB1|nr:hypothetical protein BOTBODRAFT_632859 [Botryobasidium botryosum FD-172 SS1]
MTMLPIGDDFSAFRAEAVKRVDFYFSDSNLPMDAHMWQLHTTCIDHWIPITSIISFKRMRKFKCLGRKWLVDSLRQSAKVEVDAEGCNVRRKAPVDKSVVDGQYERTVCVDGLDYQWDQAELQEDVEDMMASFGAVNAVRLQRTDDGHFGGHILVEFSESSTAERFLKENPKLPMRGRVLSTCSLDAWMTMYTWRYAIGDPRIEAIKRDYRNFGIGSAPCGPVPFFAFKDDWDQSGPVVEGHVEESNAVEEISAVDATPTVATPSSAQGEFWMNYNGHQILIRKHGALNPTEVMHVKGRMFVLTGAGGGGGQGQLAESQACCIISHSKFLYGTPNNNEPRHPRVYLGLACRR